MKSKTQIVLLIVTTWFVGTAPYTSELPAQQANSEVNGQDEVDVESKAVKGKILLNGKEVLFSNIEELEAFTADLRSALNKGSNNDGKVLPNYFEMKANDLAATKTFYESAFGFKFQDYGNSYAAVTGGPIAIGFALGSKPSVPMPAFQTFDIEASLKAVKAANGQIEKAIFKFPGGKRFEFLDSSGNRIAVFQNN